MTAKAKRKTEPQPATTDRRTPSDGNLDVLDQFVRLRKELQRAPTMREVSAAMGWSACGAQRHLQQLEELGCIEAEIVEVKGPRYITEIGKRWLAARRSIAGGD